MKLCSLLKITPYPKYYNTNISIFQQKSLNKEELSSQRSFGFGCLAECFAPLQNYTQQYFATMLPLLLNGLTDEDEQVRQNCVFGLGEIIMYSENASFEWVLNKLITTKPDRKPSIPVHTHKSSAASARQLLKNNTQVSSTTFAALCQRWSLPIALWSPSHKYYQHWCKSCHFVRTSAKTHLSSKPSARCSSKTAPSWKPTLNKSSMSSYTSSTKRSTMSMNLKWSRIFPYSWRKFASSTQTSSPLWSTRTQRSHNLFNLWTNF